MSSKVDRKARRQEQAREEIVLAAARVFAAKGFAATTVADLAKAAGYSVPSLYAYVASKQALLDELVALIESEVDAVFEMPFPTGLTFKQRVALFLQRFIAWATQNPELSAAQSSTALPEGVRRSPDAQTGPNSDLRKMTAWFAKHSTREERGGWSAEDAAYGFWGVVKGFFTRWADRAEPPQNIGPTTTKIVDFFFHGVGGAKTTEGT